MTEIEELKLEIRNLKAQVLLLTESVLDLRSDTWVDLKECAEKLEFSERTITRYREKAKIGLHYRIHGERGYRYNWREFSKLIRGES